ncbi:Hypothetical protein GbCGDNIH2_7238 [Granulibacter bethesdensis]|uniref:Uncharacterized protein n=1 Tax=Granulibacter bethesdensis (strain ATCC BAA-1260 / CGDNIH1) TaxID=391165 RepID=A0A286M304_GRABC|nr:Hypothetical protein GbCGDNIH2_7238 [Granulibacter bethesdensis]APH51796.1 Hypothetical protein GbCGDNIH5_7238 [Granulibacter bethesdensis]APH64488.1 Hypothetical protein GbCGDNIH1I4_7238 [Granulibacter bethesdensis]ASV62403.1 Hypothetical protein GbCGDNIH1_7238 [Granulibacter bethesdensis CGDNIH1]
MARMMRTTRGVRANGIKMAPKGVDPWFQTVFLPLNGRDIRVTPDERMALT